MEYNVIEKFLSIDGEGPTAGEIATFIRFGGCNLNCSWCDTAYSIACNVKGEQLTKEQIYEYIKENGADNVTLTGGEPLIQKEIGQLIYFLAQDKSLLVHIETNGTIPIYNYEKIKGLRNVSFIVDYKLPGSKMENKMHLNNYKAVGSGDVCKFVIGTEEDLKRARDIVYKYRLTERCMVYFSPVMAAVEPVKIVNFMKENKLNKVRLQLQLHKIIWPPDTRGV